MSLTLRWTFPSKACAPVACGLAALLVALVAPAALAQTQSWPTRPVRVIVPVSPGGGLDATARLLATQLAKQLGQPFVVENRPGAGYTIGTAEVARAPADGYTLLVTTPTFAISQYLYPNLPYDGQKDFTPVALVMTTPMIFVTSPKSGYKTISDYVRAAKANPGGISYSSSGSGSTPHLGFVMLEQATGSKLLHVPFKGGGEATTAIIAGTTDAYVTTPLEVRERVKGGQLVALGSTGQKRAASMPDVPTLAEQGIANYELVHYIAGLARSGTPPAILDKLSANIQEALNTPELREKLAQSGEIPAGTMKEAAELMNRSFPVWAKVVKAADVRIE